MCYFAHALATHTQSGATFLRARRSQARDSSFKASQVRATIKDIKAAAAAAKEKAREDDVANLMRQRCRRGAAMPQRRLELEDTAAPAAAERATSDEEDGDDEDAADEREWGAFFDALPKGAPDFLTLPECAPAGQWPCVLCPQTRLLRCDINLHVIQNREGYHRTVAERTGPTPRHV